MKLKNVTEEYLADLYDCDSDRVVEDYISLIREVKDIIHKATTDMGGCATDKDVEYQYLSALEQIQDMEI